MLQYPLLFWFLLKIANGYPGEVIHACAYDDRKFHFTFDDGPTINNNRTDIVLDILKEYNISATFFVIGSYVNRSNETIARVRRMVNEGHTVGSHSWSHPNMIPLTTQQIKTQIDATTKILEPIIGYKPNLFRAPYGGLSDDMLAHLKHEGYTTLQWQTGNVDWYYSSSYPNGTNEATLAMHSRIGGIITMHDGHQGKYNGVVLRNLIQLLTNDTSFNSPYNSHFNSPNFKIVSLLECLSRNNVNDIPQNYIVKTDENMLNKRDVYIVGSTILIAMIVISFITGFCFANKRNDSAGLKEEMMTLMVTTEK